MLGRLGDVQSVTIEHVRRLMSGRAHRKIAVLLRHGVYERDERAYSRLQEGFTRATAGDNSREKWKRAPAGELLRLVGCSRLSPRLGSRGARSSSWVRGRAARHPAEA